VRSRLFETQLQFGCFRSTLILCPPSEKEDPPKEKEPSETCDACKQQTSCKKKTKSTSKTNSPSSPTTRLGVGISPAHILSDTMYTNVANLQQTMLLQQQLFRQALVQNTVDVASKPTTSFTSPSLSQYQFVSGSQVGGAQLTWEHL
jgi:ligand of Numb protein X 3/4